MAGKQVDFPPDQRHSPNLERTLVVVSLILDRLGCDRHLHRGRSGRAFFDNVRR